MRLLDKLSGKERKRGSVKVMTWQTEYGGGRKSKLLNKDDEEVIGSEKIRREYGYLYFIGKDGYVWKTLIKNNPNGIKARVTNKKIKKEEGYFYFLNDEGYVARKDMAAHKHPTNKISNTKANKKYRILETDSIKPYQPYPLMLFRIEAKITFGIVKKGDKGGYIQREENLSVNGNAWIFDNARVHGDARISEDAQVYDNAEVSESAQVYGKAEVHDYAKVYGNAQVKDNAEIYGNAKVKGNALIYGRAKIYGKGFVGFNQKVGGNQEVIRDIMIDEMQ